MGRSAESYSLLRDLLRESWLLSLDYRPQACSHRRTINRHQDRRSTPIDRSVQGHPNTTRPREAPKSCPNRCCQGAMGEGWYLGKVAGERVGQEAKPEGTQKGSYGLREIQGHEIEKATAIRGPKVVGKGYGFGLEGVCWFGAAIMTALGCWIPLLSGKLCILRQ